MDLHNLWINVRLDSSLISNASQWACFAINDSLRTGFPQIQINHKGTSKLYLDPNYTTDYHYLSIKR